MMIKFEKKFPSGDWVFKCWDTNVEEVDIEIVKSIIAAFENHDLNPGVICATFKNGEIVAFTQLNNEANYKRDMETSMQLEHYEVAYFVEKYWKRRKTKERK